MVTAMMVMATSPDMIEVIQTHFLLPRTLLPELIISPLSRLTLFLSSDLLR